MPRFEPAAILEESDENDDSPLDELDLLCQKVLEVPEIVNVEPFKVKTFKEIELKAIRKYERNVKRSKKLERKLLLRKKIDFYLQNGVNFDDTSSGRSFSNHTSPEESYCHGPGETKQRSSKKFWGKFPPPPPAGSPPGHLQQPIPKRISFQKLGFPL